MKKLLSLVSVFCLVFTLQTMATASTIGVNVGQGYSVSVENEDLDGDALKITGNVGVSDQFMVRLGYVTEDTDPGTPFLGFRYEIQKNFAGSLEYSTNDQRDKITVGLRAKKNFSKAFAIVGKAEYFDVQSDAEKSYGGYALTGQAEYAFSQLISGNVGVAFEDNDSQNDAITTFLAGVEFYPTNRLSCWLDYSQSDVKDADAKIGLGLEFKF